MGRLKVQMQWFYWVPKKWISRCVGWFAHCRCRYLSRFLIRCYRRAFHISLDEAEHTDIADYACLNDFFTRALKSQARPIDAREQIICSPCDGIVGQFGRISGATLLQAKGQHYTIDELLVGSGTEPFLNGRYITIYLSPKDYHRVHVPVTGGVTQMMHVPGSLFPVFPKAVNTVSHLYTRNERVLFWIETERGPVALAMIGALNVGSVTVTGYGPVTSSNRMPSVWKFADPMMFQKGAELARFNMGGSCVVALFPDRVFEWSESLEVGCSVLMGQSLNGVMQ